MNRTERRQPGHVPAQHTPLDSLLYIEASTSILDWISEELGGVHSDEPDLELVIEHLDSFHKLIRDELRVHGRRARYSVGHLYTLARRGDRER